MANKMFDFSWQFKNFAIKTCHENWNDKTSPIKKDWPIEVIKYIDDKHTSCYVIAAWQRAEDGYELRFIGDRPFKDIEPEEMSSIWVQLRAAQKMLDEFYKADEEEDEGLWD